MTQAVMCPIDLEQESSWRAALPAAIDHARRAKAKLYVMTVVPDYAIGATADLLAPRRAATLAQETRRRIEDFAREHVPSDIDVEVLQAEGTVHSEILRLAAERQVGLIVMAAHRPELRDVLLGPTAAHIVRHAHCSVLVVRE